ncbi:polysaccharide deacetylase family protein [Bacteroidota bacterium]
MRTVIVTCLLIGLFFMGCKSPEQSENKSEKRKVPDKLVVLTFDDAVKSHLTYVAPVLKKHGFNATFFISYAWMIDTLNFLNWQEVAELYKMGFEIGNHSWTHSDFSQPKNASQLEGELGLVEWMLRQVGIPKPVSYAHTGNFFGPEAIEALKTMGIKYARRGMQPEIPYGELKPGPGYNPNRHHPLLIPTTSDSYPGISLDHFKKVLESVKDGEITVLQFHGIPDPAHPWVTTEPQVFDSLMNYLKENKYTVIAMKDLQPYIPDEPIKDPLLEERYTLAGHDPILPDEVIATRERSEYWLRNMALDHKYTVDEIAKVFRWDTDKVDSELGKLDQSISGKSSSKMIKMRPFPGGRHPRISFRDGMLSPMRGTKLSVFLPWSENDFLVLDLPEAVMTQYGLTFLGHKHIPSVYDYQLKEILNSDWNELGDGSYQNLWKLPGNIDIGAKAMPGKEHVDMEIWLTNRTQDTVLTDMQTQVCVMLGQAEGYKALTNDNKIIGCPVVVVNSESGNRWILTAWEGCSHPWGNPDCPCMHADPSFPDCPPGETVRLHGKLWFYHGTDIHSEIDRFNKLFSYGNQ